MKLIIISATGATSSYPRLNKLLELSQDMSLAGEHWYWLRKGEIYRKDIGSSMKPLKLLSGLDTSSSLLIVGYIILIMNILIHCVKLKEGIRIYSIGFIPSLGVYLASKYNRNIEYAFDEHDEFSKSKKFNRLAIAIISLIEKKIRNRAKLHIIPSQNRITTVAINTRIVPNIPSKRSILLSKKIYLKRGGDLGNIFTVYVNGLLTEDRGLNKIMHAIENTADSPRFRFIIAGKLNEETIEMLKKYRHTKYMGVLDYEEALSYYFSSSVVVTLYNPDIEINRLAESTKWGDCLATSTPFVANYGIETLSKFPNSNLVHLIDYNDKSSLLECLISLSNKESKISVSDRLNAEGVSWDELMIPVIRELMEVKSNIY